MQIQRIQTLWLLLGAVASGVSLIFPWFRVGDVSVDATESVPLLVAAILAVALPLLAIFMYKSLGRQKLVAKLGALFSLLTIGYAVALSTFGPDGADAGVCVLAPVCMAMGGIFDYLAVKGIVRDERLLRSADRLR